MNLPAKQVTTSSKRPGYQRMLLAATQWERRVNELAEFHRRHGHFMVPVNYAISPGLGGWASRQRMKMRKGSLSRERRRQLERLGMSCAYLCPYGGAWWEQRFGQLAEFQRSHGHFDIPNQVPTASLYNWANTQRLANVNGDLASDRRLRLEQLGFPFDQRTKTARGEQAWNQNFERIAELHRLNGHFKIPTETPHRVLLYLWITTQRCLKKYGRLRPDREQRLDAIGFPWSLPPRKHPKHKSP